MRRRSALPTSIALRAPRTAAVCAARHPVLLQVALGKPRDWPTYGWDNEYGKATRAVGAFSASQYAVTNGQFFEFVTDGGYRTERFWTADG